MTAGGNDEAVKIDNQFRVSKMTHNSINSSNDYMNVSLVDFTSDQLILHQIPETAS